MKTSFQPRRFLAAVLVCFVVLCRPAKSAAAAADTASSSLSTRQPRQKKTASSSSLTTLLKGGLAGGSSRALAQMTLYPVDALRTLAQTRDGRTLKDVGLASLVRGSATTSAFALGMGSMQFGIFGACRARGIPALWASALGAAGSCIVSVPQEVIKQRLVTKIYPSFTVAVKSIAQTEGIKGFYAAWRPTMARNVPFVMTTFTTMDMLKSTLLRRHPEKQSLSTAETVVVGVAAAFVAGVITNPMGT